MLSSGNGALDALLGGGLESGTTTVITGPPGGGKSALGMQFLEHSVTLDRRGILYAFEESAESIVARSRGIGMSVTQLLKTGALKIVPVNPLELYPDEFLSLVRTGVEQDGCRIVMIDSLQGYQTAMEEFGTMAANIRNLTTYLNRHGVTTLLVNEVEHITGDIVATEHALSYVVDNIILLRYAEYSSGIIKVIGCLKKRLGGHQTELRQLQITPGGIQVSEPLAHLRGILTGAPSLMMDDITPALPVH
jgi:circadian clock protein KaiC